MCRSGYQRSESRCRLRDRFSRRGRQCPAVSHLTARIVILTVYEDKRYRTDAAAAGASAYVPKRVMQSKLMPTLAALLANDHDGEEVKNRASQ
jgi:DNA-binding NarL/FixJ family response regulator